MTLDQIKGALQDRNLSAVARLTGISVFTLYNIMRGKNKPHRATLRVLADYLKG